MKRVIQIVCVAVVCVSLVSVAQARNFIEFAVSRELDDDRYHAGIYIDIPGATAIELVHDPRGTLPFEMQDDGFWLQTSDFATLDVLNTNIAGTHILRITHTSGNSEYEYTRKLITEGIFANVPVLNAVPAIIPQNYNFQWTWSGTANEMYAVAQIYDKLFKYEDEGGIFVIGATTNWTPDFSSETGNGSFVIDYSDIGDVKLGDEKSISGWSLYDGTELFSTADDEIDDCIDSQDIAYFTVALAPGDTNGDGIVDAADYDNLVAQFGGPPGADSADFNGDNLVDLEDVAIMRDNFGFGVVASPEAGATTPEPATLSMLALGGLAMLRRRRK